MIRFQNELKVLTDRLMEMAEKTLGMVRDSVNAILQGREELADQVLHQEDEINRMEVEIENRAIALIARFQPEAENLRTLIMIIKINNDLERIADHAVNIAERAKTLIHQPPVKPYIDLPRMAEIAQGMLEDALVAFMGRNAQLAQEVCTRDNLVDQLYLQIFRELLVFMMEDPHVIERSIRIIEVAKNLERIADLATNLAEDVVYIVEGRIIKHHFGESPPSS